MSYEAQPEWTNDIDIHKSSYRNQNCPSCGVPFGNMGEVRSCMFDNSYYHPQHIPPTLTFTCFNPACVDCDDDFIVHVSARIGLSTPVKEE